MILQKETLYWQLLVGGFFLFSTGSCMHDYIFIDKNIFRIVSLLGVVCILAAYLKLPKRYPFKGIWRNLFNLFLWINIITILRGIINPVVPYHSFLISSSYMWTYLMPFIMFLKPTSIFVKTLSVWIWIYAYFALAFCLYNFPDFYINASEVMRSMIGWDAFYVNRPQVPCKYVLPCCAFLFYYHNFPKNKKIVLWITIVLSLGAALMAGRRSSAATVLCFILAAICYLYYKSNRKLFILLSIIIIVGWSAYHINFQFWEEKFEYLLGRIDADTRSGVETDFFKDMTSAFDWIFGRGMSGTYMSPSVAEIDKLHRNVIETGYLNLILHGGLCLLIPYVMLMIKSVYQGLFFSHNLLCKVCAIYIGMHILFLYPGGTPQLSIQYLMLYIFIAICNSRTWLTKTENEIKLSVTI